MQGTCPRCKASLDLPASGAYRCSNCQRSFRVYLPGPHATVAAARAAAATAAGAGARCATHTNNVAVGSCERCGDFMCALCSTPTEGRNYCPSCFDLLVERGGLKFTQRDFNAPQTALWLAIDSLPALACCGLGVVLALVSVVIAIGALQRIARQPELPGRNKALAALGISAVSLLAALLLLLRIVSGS